MQKHKNAIERTKQKTNKDLIDAIIYVPIITSLETRNVSNMLTLQSHMPQQSETYIHSREKKSRDY